MVKEIGKGLTECVCVCATKRREKNCYASSEGKMSMLHAVSSLSA
jgi:hypothetical protein